MQNPIPHIINNNTFWVSPERCLYWEQQNTIIIADMHLGKAGHFRKSGIPVPQDVNKADLQRLIALLLFFKADRVIIVGDFTHSAANKELELFKRWRSDFPLFRFDLVKGNHDILEDHWYFETDITVHKKELVIGDFCFRHETPSSNPLDDCAAASFVFSGHVHPGIRMSGQGRQTLKLPCFYFTKNHCILPAFSKFTGLYKVEPKEEDLVYAIAGTEIIKKP
ncbi:MAG: ligase-associated DNA damage response endonuclease PdeM [Sphingobacteriales bacterium]|nr:ligase-associated DNA damage response endonuclease PdeM [Sphingobacteriales bacterium]